MAGRRDPAHLESSSRVLVLALCPAVLPPRKSQALSSSWGIAHAWDRSSTSSHHMPPSLSPDQAHGAQRLVPKDLACLLPTPGPSCCQSPRHPIVLSVTFMAVIIHFISSLPNGQEALAGVGSCFLPRAICILIISFEGHAELST